MDGEQRIQTDVGDEQKRHPLSIQPSSLLGLEGAGPRHHLDFRTVSLRFLLHF